MTKTIDERRQLLVAGFNTGDLEILGRLVTDDVVWLLSGQQPWVGKGEVLGRLERILEQFDYELELRNARVDTDGNRAVERSSFVSRVYSGSEPVGPPHRGSVVIVWVRQEDWKIGIYLDVGSTVFE